MKIACGLDIHKDSVFCYILCANGEKIQHKFGVLTEELVTLRDLMVSEGVEECAMESTSIYWIPIWRVLERSVKLHLVNPYFINKLPGKNPLTKIVVVLLFIEEIQFYTGTYIPFVTYKSTVAIFHLDIFKIMNVMYASLSKIKRMDYYT